MPEMWGSRRSRCAFLPELRPAYREYACGCCNTATGSFCACSGACVGGSARPNGGADRRGECAECGPGADTAEAADVGFLGGAGDVRRGAGFGGVPAVAVCSAGSRSRVRRPGRVPRERVAGVGLRGSGSASTGCGAGDKRQTETVLILRETWDSRKPKLCMSALFDTIVLKRTSVQYADTKQHSTA